MEAKDIKWCPQHGYPLPCAKCGFPLSQLDQQNIYKAGIKLVVDWIETKKLYHYATDPYGQRKEDTYSINIRDKVWQAFKKEHGIE